MTVVDPRPRPDNLCLCGCGQPRATRAEHAYASKAQFDVDPFASRKCCERYHGVKEREGLLT